ncbi:toll/interleukin-1 receptor domain-containing protein [Herbiconiux sp. P18]|uniref:toll/interleukin-1 receptor domain-containing protein n=1 Tax=Herbiconiux liangxiaofengii TaxID=3342795 RepID=UPI0035B982CE
MTEHDFDVAVTFAGEDRVFVEEVVNLVKEAGFSVFYDEDYKYESWGEDLTEYFPDVYERRARFAVMFISQHYAAKPWTRLERRSVLARALNAQDGYLLPVRLDSTRLPGVRDAIGYLDGLTETPTGIARAIGTKLGAPESEQKRLFNGRIPRTAAELAIMLGERPPAWEYLLFAYHLHQKTEALSEQYTDFRLGFATPRGFLADEDLADTLGREIAVLRSIASMLETLLVGPAQDEAMGELGTHGDPQLIEALAARITTLYEELLAWAKNLRALATKSDEAAAVVRATAAQASQPIQAMHQFVNDYRQVIDGISARLIDGEKVTMQMPIEFTIPDAVRQDLNRALEAFRRHMG